MAGQTYPHSGSASVSQRQRRHQASTHERVKMGDGESKMLIYDVGGGVFDGSLSINKDGILEVRAMLGDDHLYKEDFENGTVGVGTQEFMRKGSIVGLSWKQTKHPPSEWGANAPNTFYLPRSQPSRLFSV